MHTYVLNIAPGNRSVLHTAKSKVAFWAMLSDDDLKQLGMAALGDHRYLSHIFTNSKETEKVNIHINV